MDNSDEYHSKLNELNRQIEQNPDNVKLLIDRAMHYGTLSTLKLSDEEKSHYEKEFQTEKERIINLKLIEIKDIFNRALFLENFNGLSEAINDYKSILNKGLKHPILFNQLGVLYTKTGKYILAIDYFNKCEKEGKKDKYLEKIGSREIHQYRGICYFYLDKYAKAYSDLSKMNVKDMVIYTELSQKRPVYQYIYAVTCYFTKNYFEALKYFNDILKTCPEDHICLFYRSNIFKKLGKMENAKKDQIKLEQKLKENNYYYEDIGIIYYKMKKRNKAIECFRKVENDLNNEAINIIEQISLNYLKKNNYAKAREVCEGYACALDQSWWNIGYPLHEHLKSISEKQKTHELLKEREKVIADLSHSIKNLISSVIDPLENLKNEKEVKLVTIDNALRGSNLIREIVNAMNLSYRGSINDFKYDARNNNEKDSISLKMVVIESLIYSIINMFDGKYFQKYHHKYFPNKEIFIKTKKEWNVISQSGNLDKIITFINKFFFKINIDFDSAADNKIGNEKGSAIKLMILIQEMIFNAVKYVAFVQKKERFINIKISSADKFKIQTENSYNTDIERKKSGLGQVIIRNIAKLLNTEPVIHTENNVYSVYISFNNIWS